VLCRISNKANKLGCVKPGKMTQEKTSVVEFPASCSNQTLLWERVNICTRQCDHIY